MSEKFKLAFDFFLLAIGAIIAAFAIEEFLVPCTIFAENMVNCLCYCSIRYKRLRAKSKMKRE